MGQKYKVFDSQEEIGLFATLYFAIAVAKFGHRKGFTPIFTSSNPLYVDPSYGANWIEYFFDYKKLGSSLGEFLKKNESIEKIELPNRRQANRIISGAPFLDIQNKFKSTEQGANLFFEHLSIKSEIIREIDRFVNERFQGRDVVGVHYRGTDKHFDEADPVAFEAVAKAVEKYGGANPTVFLATDDGRLPLFLQERYGEERVIMRREPSGLSHFEDMGSNYTKGLDAILDCMLLARCGLLIKTPSQLSAWSKIFNSDLRLVLMGEPYKRTHNFEYKGEWWDWHIPLRNKGYYPESALYDRRKHKMRKNRVLEIIDP